MAAPTDSTLGPTERRVQEASDDAISKEADIMIMGMKRKVDVDFMNMYNEGVKGMHP